MVLEEPKTTKCDICGEMQNENEISRNGRKATNKQGDPIELTVVYCTQNNDCTIQAAKRLRDMVA